MTENHTRSEKVPETALNTDGGEWEEFIFRSQIKRKKKQRKAEELIASD